MNFLERLIAFLKKRYTYILNLIIRKIIPNKNGIEKRFKEGVNRRDKESMYKFFN